MDIEGARHQLAAIVSIRIADYAETMERDEGLALSLVNSLRKLIESLAAGNGGRVVEEAARKGSLLVTFDSSVLAARFALAVQGASKTDLSLALQIGIHTAEVLIEGKSVLGPGVHAAERISALAPAGGIWISGNVWDLIKNQPGLESVSQGLKTILTSSEPVEVRELRLATGRRPAHGPPTLPREFLKRGIPQVVAPYLVATWAALQFIDWAAKRYLLSPHLIDFSLVAFASMLPTVMLIALLRSRPTRKRPKVGRVGIPVNVLAAGAVLFFMFHGKPLGAITQAVVVTNEEGVTSTRAVPRPEFQRRVAVFFFDSESLDAARSWLGHGFTAALVCDLEQDPAVKPYSGYLFLNPAKDAGFPDGSQLPLSLKQTIATENHAPYFVAGTLTGKGGAISVRVRLYNTTTCKPVSDRVFEQTDVFKLVDSVSAQLQLDLGLPPNYLAQLKDMPVSEVFTGSLPAFRAYMDAMDEVNIELDWQKGTKSFERAVACDPTFARALWHLQSGYAYAGMTERAETTMQRLMQYIYRLPERTQFEVKSGYYLYSPLQMNLDKALAVAKMWTQVIPEDMDGHYRLATIYRVRGLPDSEITVYKHSLELDPTQYDYLENIGNAYQGMGRFDSAVVYFKRYAAQYPDQCDAILNLADTYTAMGDFVQAAEYYQKSLALKPDEARVFLGLARMKAAQGNMDEARKQYGVAMIRSKTILDSTFLYMDLERFCRSQGQMRWTMAWGDSGMALQRRQGLLSQSLVYEMSYLLPVYADMGMDSYVLHRAQAISQQLGSQARLAELWVRLQILMRSDDPDIIEQAAESLKSELDPGEPVSPECYRALGRACELRANFSEAINNYAKARGSEINPDDAAISSARCHRRLKQFKLSLAELNAVLKPEPANPEANYEMAMVYADMGNKNEALKHLNMALDVWKDADPDYIPALDAKRELATIEQTP
jgi:tetratricopeptide (TPR) repeat protein/class 3 adenylate cyclase